MPTYTYHCEECDEPFEKVLPMSRYDEPQNCPSCNEGPARKTIPEVGMIFKGDGWATKNNRVAGQMRRKNQRLSSISSEKKREAGISLTPNVGGEKTGSWSEAAKLAKSQGKDPSGYQQRAASEKK